MFKVSAVASSIRDIGAIENCPWWREWCTIESGSLAKVASATSTGSTGAMLFIAEMIITAVVPKAGHFEDIYLGYYNYSLKPNTFLGNEF